MDIQSLAKSHTYTQKRVIDLERKVGKLEKYVEKSKKEETQRKIKEIRKDVDKLGKLIKKTQPKKTFLKTLKDIVFSINK